MLSVKKVHKYDVLFFGLRLSIIKNEISGDLWDTTASANKRSNSLEPCLQQHNSKIILKIGTKLSTDINFI